MAAHEKLKSLIQAGSNFVGAAVGGALGFAAGGPATAAGASVAGAVVGHVLGDMANRALSEREATRVSATAAIAAQIINERLEAGEKLREDGFFGSEGPNERSPAAEIFEGILLAARNAHEEKKLKHLGMLFANIAFLENCSPGEANFQIKTAESLTYGQYCLLQLFALEGNPYHFPTEGNYGGAKQMAPATIAHLLAVYELRTAGLVQGKQPGFTGVLSMDTIEDIIPEWMKLTPAAERLRDLLSR